VGIVTTRYGILIVKRDREQLQFLRDRIAETDAFWGTPYAYGFHDFQEDVVVLMAISAVDSARSSLMGWLYVIDAFVRRFTEEAVQFYDYVEKNDLLESWWRPNLEWFLEEIDNGVYRSGQAIPEPFRPTYDRLLERGYLLTPDERPMSYWSEESHPYNNRLVEMVFVMVPFISNRYYEAFHAILLPQFVRNFLQNEVLSWSDGVVPIIRSAASYSAVIVLLSKEPLPLEQIKRIPPCLQEYLVTHRKVLETHAARTKYREGESIEWHAHAMPEFLRGRPSVRITRRGTVDNVLFFTRDD
jgi:hypothetical protein